MNRTLSTLGWLLLAALALPASAHDDANGTWRRITNPGPALGLDGQMHQARCSGFPGTDPTFSFWAKRGKSKNLVVYFEGGGACWDNLTCTFPIADGLPAQVPQFFVPAVPAGADPAGYDGIFKADHPANPVKDWSAVYIPYCTGDLHAGSAERSYQNVGHPVLPLPSSFTLQHRGFDNFMVVMNWAKKHLAEPKSVLVTGSSAGGYGASINFPWVAQAWPKAKLQVLADASQGVTTVAWDSGTPGRGSWNLQLPPAVARNAPPLVRGADFLALGAKALPRARTAQFTTVQDGVQIGFYSVMKANYGPGGACPSPAGDWYQQMSAKVQSFAADLPNFRYYLAAGDYHTALRSPLFYTEASTGMPLSQWTADLLAGRRGDDKGDKGDGDDDGPRRWTHQACPTCLLNLVCP
jgi:Pectinacetylesterase